MILAMQTERERLAAEEADNATVPSSSSSGGGKKKSAKQAAAAAAAAAGGSAASRAAAADDPNAVWSAVSIAKLSASADPDASLQLALLRDPASPHPHLRDIAEALRLYGVAAIKANSAFACARLAHFYLTGGHSTTGDASSPPVPVPGGKDMAKGAKWLSLGARRGHVLCAYQLGFLHEEGMIDGRRNPALAMQLYTQAAEAKYPQAMYNLAMMLLQPDGTFDEDIAATHTGPQPATHIEQDVYRGVRLLEDAASLGDVSSQLKLGHLCFMGDADLDVEASVPRAIHYLTLAAHNEEPSVDAAKILGIIYCMDDTSTFHNQHRDLPKSIHYLGIAAHAGHQDSRTLLARQQAKLNKIQRGMVIDKSASHNQALAHLTLEEQAAYAAQAATGVAIEHPHAKPAAGADADAVASLVAASSSAIASAMPLSTPSTESLLLALTRLRTKHPEHGAARLHQALRAEYSNWACSEARIKKLMREQGWAADGGAAKVSPGPGAEVAASATTAAPGPAAASAQPVVAPRITDRAIVNDLD